ncbi:hypothetical protein AOLI_G00187860 [Acnodon oligacanthus]
MFFLTEILHVREMEGAVTLLFCGNVTNSTVTWSRDVNGQTVDILTTHNGETTKHVADPDRRYSSGSNGMLIIFRLYRSDAGRYYCSGAPVELTVTEGGVSVVESVLMFGGVGLAALTFLLATVAAGRVINESNKIQ